MELILWRHAEAEDATPDLSRRLTDKGKRQASFMADWLTPRLPKDLRILVSPAVRTRQTADALNMKYTVVEDIAPDRGAAKLLAAAGWEKGEGTVLVVGHQPTLGLAASLLLYGQERSFSIKKGAIFWISRRGPEASGECVLRAVLSPDMLNV